MTQEPYVVKQARDIGHELFTEITAYFCKNQTVVSEAIFVPMAIFSRIMRTHDAITSLIADDFCPEAAVLVLTQLELRLDVAYTASVPDHATKWLSHEDKKWQVMTIAKKIKTLFRDGGDEAERLKEITQYLHGIKHEYPVYSELGFPVRLARR